MQRFPCPYPNCGRSYPTKNSLARHTHNHREADHECDLCGVKFRRRDILLRHRKIHTDAQGAGAPPNPAGDLKKRRRCHTACVSCRKARSKCDGERPCSACRAAQRECEYDRNTLRLSHKPSGSTSEQSPIPQEVSDDETRPAPSIDAIQPDMESHAVSPAAWQPLATRKRSYMPEDPALLKPIDRRLGAASPRPKSTPDVSHIDAGYTPRLDGSTASIDTSPELPDWQWAHEGMFLQADPSSVWSSQPSDRPLQPNQLPQPASLPVNAAAVPVSNMPLPSPRSATDWFKSGSSVRSRSSLSDMLGAASPSHSQPSPSAHGYDDKADRHPGVDAILSLAQSSSSQSSVIADIVAYAKEVGVKPAVPGSNYGKFWQMVSARVDEAFFPGAGPRNGPCTLHRFVDLYFMHFHQLWVLIVNPHMIDLNTLHPILYVTLASIGGMYDGNRGATFAALLHEALRETLTAHPTEFAQSEAEPLWLVQSLVLTQLAAVYFGHRRAFSAAQHIGCILFTQSRRMNLFSARRYRRKHIEAMRRTESIEVRRKIWIALELKIRLAYGIYRADIYMSVLLGTRPFMSHSEMDVEVDAYVFNPDIINRMDEHINSAIHDPDALKPKLLFSDLLRVALDREEPLPTLSLAQHEILIWALNEDVWEYAHDPSAIPRLTGTVCLTPGGLQRQLSAPLAQPDLSLAAMESRSAHQGEQPISAAYNHGESREYSGRAMHDLRASSQRLFTALTKWEQSFAVASQDPEIYERFRDKVIVSLLLYHLTYIRLNAPIENLHKLCYSLDDRESGGIILGSSPAPYAAQAPGWGISGGAIGRPRLPDNELLSVVSSWAASGQAESAVEHACHIWAIIAKELTLPAQQRAKLNLMAFIGLHHSVAVVWSWSLGRKREGVPSMPENLGSPTPDLLGRSWPYSSNALGTQARNLVLPVGKLAAEVATQEGGAGSVRIIAALVEPPSSSDAVEDPAGRSVVNIPSSTSVGADAAGPGPIASTAAEMPADVQMCREEIPVLLASFARLYERSNPAWGVRSSFAEAAWRLAKRGVPDWFG